jgi:hypothetical protein
MYSVCLRWRRRRQRPQRINNDDNNAARQLYFPIFININISTAALRTPRVLIMCCAAVTPARQKVHLSVEILMFRRRRVIASRATHKEKLQSNRESVAFGPLISGLSKK